MKDLDLLPGTLDMLVMQVLWQRQCHGYEIARFINQYSHGRFRIIDGALYTALHRLEARGWVRSQWGHSTASRRAKFYELTDTGRRAFRKEASNWYRYVTGVCRVMTASSRHRSMDEAGRPETGPRDRHVAADVDSPHADNTTFSQ